jgi:hypothetical protein
LQPQRGVALVQANLPIYTIVVEPGILLMAWVKSRVGEVLLGDVKMTKARVDFETRE